MADMNTIKDRIIETIFPNGTGAITAESHQALLLELVEVINESKADKQGKNPQMEVGFANNLVGRGESTPTQFTFRASGGKSIADGTATIKRIKGNTVVVNGQSVNMRVRSIKSIGDNAWNKYMAVRGVVNDQTGVFTPDNNVLTVVDLIRCLPGEQYYFSNVVHYNYRAAFHFYDANMNFIGIDGIWDSSNNTFASNILTIPTEAHYMRVATPYDCVDKCMVTLVHTGWRQDTDAAYQPYWEDNKDLSIIRKYFPSGMRSSAGVYDEISYNSYTQQWEAIQRIDTDGGIINDIVTPILEPLNLSYQVADFGTEEAISEEISAPFSADIIYQFNAVDMIRELWYKVEALETKINK